MSDDREFRAKQGFLQSVLKWSVSQQQQAAGADAPAPHPLEPERREFLENVFKAMSHDVIKEMTECTNVLTDPASDGPAKVAALEAIQDLVEDLDNARDYATLGGPRMLVPLLEDCASPAIQAVAADVLATMAQNNPHIQELFVRDQILTSIETTLAFSLDDLVRLKCLRALSCTIRESEQRVAEFFRRGGVALLAYLLRNALSTAAGARLAAKVCFFIECVPHSPALLANLCEQSLPTGLQKMVIVLLTTADSPHRTADLWERGIAALRVLLSGEGSANVTAAVACGLLVPALVAHVAQLRVTLPELADGAPDFQDTVLTPATLLLEQLTAVAQ